MRRAGLIALALVALLGAACGDDSDTDTATPATESTDTTATTAAPAADSTVALRQTSLGQVLADSEGRTLYVFMKDSAGKSACDGQCAATWPPLMAEDDLTAGTGLDQAKLTTITRTDGSKQVAYGGAPLYRYAKDTAPGDVTGQGVGGNWWVVGADGKPIMTTAESTTTTA